jgi:hypothetical protein
MRQKGAIAPLPKIKKLFYARVERGCSAYFRIASEKKNLKPIPFKVDLSWKQCSCDVITGKFYYRWCLTRGGGGGGA